MSSFAQKKKANGRAGGEYVVLASKAVQQDAAWMQVDNALKEKHRAEVGTAFLDFQVGKYQILPDFRNNAV